MKPAPRIVSLLPSATEMVCALGLEEALVGVTHECDHPTRVARLPKVTRTVIPADATSGEIDALVRARPAKERALYTLDTGLLARLAPDLLVTQGLCDVCAVAEEEVRSVACELSSAPRVVNLEPHSLETMFDALRDIAVAAGVEERAGPVIAALRARVAAVEERSRRITNRPRVVLLEWLDPPFSSGHWSPELVRLAGGSEAVGVEGRVSRTLRWEEVITARPDVVVLACCGFDVPRTLRDLPLLFAVPGFDAVPAARNDRVYVVDGSQYFSRPGPRLVDSLEILAHALHPDVHPLPAGLAPAERVSASARRS
jgi:iron complex transport system substrate-binding protein